MAYKAMFVLACAMALAHALPAPEDDVQAVEVSNIQAIPVVESQQVDAQERGDLVVSADTSGGQGGWGWEPAPAKPQGWGWEAPVQKGWGWPKFKYLKFTIPIPILPRIKFGIKGGLKLNAAIQHPKGWGWSR